jgi:tetratricopeptide (TPR) repeat protein
MLLSDKTSANPAKARLLLLSLSLMLVNTSMIAPSTASESKGRARQVEASVRVDEYEGGISEDDADRGVLGVRFAVSTQQLPFGGRQTSTTVLQTVVKGGPADLAGLRPNDLILTIDGRSTNGMNKTQVNKCLRGEPDTQVTVVVQRGTERLTYTITRGRFEKLPDREFKSSLAQQDQDERREKRLADAAEAVLIEGSSRPYGAINSAVTAEDRVKAIQECDEARFHAEKGEYVDAEKRMKRAIQFDPECVEARYFYALLLDRAGKFADASAYLSEITKLKPDWIDGLLALAAAEHSRGHLEQAVAAYKKALMLCTNKNDELELRRTIAALQESLQSPAIGQSRKSLATAKSDSRKSGASTSGAKTSSGAPGSAGTTTSDTSEHAELSEALQFVNQARDQIKEKRFDEAAEKLRQAIALDSSCKEAWQTLGFCQYTQGKSAEAAESLKKFLALAADTPEAVWAWQALAATEDGQGNLTQAEDAFKTFLKVAADDPNKSLAWRGLAGVYERQGKYTDAAQAFITYLELAPEANDAAPIWQHIGACYQNTGRFNDAIDAYEKYIKLAPDSPDRTEVEHYISSLQQELGHPNRRSPDSEDYLLETTREGLARWERRPPLKVFMAKSSNVEGFRPEYDEAVRHAFSEWEEASEGRLKFEFVENPRRANIECVWINDSAQLGSPVKGGHAEVSARGHEISKVTIKLLTVRGKNRTAISKETAHMIALHEIGHSLGLRGHSSNPNDVMFPYATHGQLSERDKRTLTALYKAPKPRAEYDGPRVQFTH